jgi:hypothetical protein
MELPMGLSHPRQIGRVGGAGLIASVLGLLVIQSASAAGPPRFNIRATCRQAEPLSGDKSVYQSCVDEEVSARKQVVSTWASYRSRSLRSCVGETRIGGAPSYVDLLTCLQFDKGAPSLPP